MVVSSASARPQGRIRAPRQSARSHSPARRPCLWMALFAATIAPRGKDTVDAAPTAPTATDGAGVWPWTSLSSVRFGAIVLWGAESDSVGRSPVATQLHLQL